MESVTRDVNLAVNKRGNSYAAYYRFLRHVSFQAEDLFVLRWESRYVRCAVTLDEYVTRRLSTRRS